MSIFNSENLMGAGEGTVSFVLKANLKAQPSEWKEEDQIGNFSQINIYSHISSLLNVKGLCFLCKQVRPCELSLGISVLMIVER